MPSLRGSGRLRAGWRGRDRRPRTGDRGRISGPAVALLGPGRCCLRSSAHGRGSLAFCGCGLAVLDRIAGGAGSSRGSPAPSAVGRW